MQNLNKEQALEKLEALKSSFDQQTKELQKIIENADKKLPAIDRLDSIEDAIAELGEDDIEVKEYRKMQKADLSIKSLAAQRILIWVKAVNEGYLPDWNNSNEGKYLIWFDMRKEAGKGFFVSVFSGFIPRMVSLPATFTSRKTWLCAQGANLKSNKNITIT